MKKRNVIILKAGALAALAVAACAGIQYGVGAGVTMLGLMSAAVAPAAQAAFAHAPRRNTRTNAQSGARRTVPVDKVSYIKELKSRSRILQPATATRVLGILDKFEEGLKPENAKATAEKLRELTEKARKGDVEAKAAIAQMRIVTVDNFLTAATNPIAFFETVVLANDEIPFIENITGQEITVSYLGQDGRARKTQPVPTQENAQVDLHVLSTPEFEYVLRDIYSGSVKDSQLASVDMARDLNYQVSKKMWPFIKSAIGNFVTTGPIAKRTYLPHSIINVNNLPTTNLLTPSTALTNTSKFNKECLDAILIYAGSWGDTLGGGAMKPAAVILPSSEMFGFLSAVNFTTPTNSKVEEIFENGFILSYGGVNWTFIGDATLNPKDGLAYVKFDKPIGIYFTKPGMDQTFEDESIEMQKQNRGSVSMNKVVGWGLPINWFVNVAAVQYHNDVN